jgi:hypothetical protein
MDDFFKCSKMESTFKNDFLTMPKKGHCSLDIENDNSFGTLVLNHLKDRVYFSQKNDEWHISCHKVINKSLFFKENQIILIL